MRLSLPLFLLAEGTSLFGNSAIGIVLPWLILSRTHDPAAAGLVAMVTGLPAIVAALVGGHLIDLVGARRMAVLADCGSAVSVAALAVVDRLWGLDLAWFIVLGLVGALFDVPGMTARETLVGRVAESAGRSVDAVAGLRQSVFGVSFLAGPALAGLLLSLLDPATVVWLTAGCSAVAALATAVMPLVTQPSPQGAAEPPSLLGGWQVIRTVPGLLSILLVSFASTVPVAPLLSVILPAHFTVMDAPALLGTATSAYAVGSIIGSVLYAAWTKRWRWGSWVAAILMYTVSFVLIGSLRGFLLVASGMALAGLAGGMIGPLFTVGMVERVGESHRGRVFGVMNALALVAAPLGLGMITLVLSQSSLAMGAWAMVLLWLPTAAFALLAPGLRHFLAPLPGPTGAPATEGIVVP